MATTTAEWIVKNDKIPRPMNCYFVFLSDFRSKALESGGPGTGRSLKRQHGISRDARDAWRALSRKERGLWIEKAERLKELHEKMYPGYKYLPLGAAESGLAKKGTKKRERAVREWALRQAAEREKAAAEKAELVCNEAHCVVLRGRWAAPEGGETRPRANGGRTGLRLESSDDFLFLCSALFNFSYDQL